MIARAMRLGFTKGVLDGSRPWLILGGIAATFRLLKKMSGNEPKVVYSGELLPGQTLVISNPHESS